MVIFPVREGLPEVPGGCINGHYLEEISPKDHWSLNNDESWPHYYDTKCGQSCWHGQHPLHRGDRPTYWTMSKFDFLHEYKKSCRNCVEAKGQPCRLKNRYGLAG